MSMALLSTLGLSTLGGGAVLTAAWRPFLDPLPLHQLGWVLLIPMALGIAVVYKAVRVRTFAGFWREVGVMTAQIVLSMILLGAAVYIFIEYYARWVAEHAA